MPVEETANLLIMAGAYMRYTPVPGRGSAYAQTHYAIFKQWADYLLSTPNGVGTPNALDPQFQNQTDDFTGSIAHSVNLSLKGIIAVGAMGQIAADAGNMADAGYYTAQAHLLIHQWMQMAQNNTSTHLLLQYQEPANPYSPDTTGEPDSAWSLKYNAFPDRLLGLNLIPASILREEAAFDTTREQQFGIPLDYRNSYTKTDWELWTVASTDDTLLRQDVFDGIYNAFNTTPDRVPFTDWYEPATGRRTGFLARPVIGGVFAALFNFTAAPIMSPGPGLYSSGQTVTFTEATPGAVIYYTTDGSLPTANSPVYSGPLPIFRSMNLQAVAIAGGTQASPVAGGVYTILTTPTLQNGSFEKPKLVQGGLRTNPLGAVWVFTGAAGIESNGSSLGAASAPDGTQTAFLQGSSSVSATAGSPGAISQVLSFTRAGAFSVTFQAARRLGQVQPLKLTLDGVQVGPLLTPPGNSFSTLTSASFAISTPGRHTLALTATNTSSNLTTFVDQVKLTASALPLPPTALTAKAGGDRVRLTWTAGALAATYTLYRATTPGGTTGTPLAAGLTATTYTDTAVTNGTTYYYRVASVNSFGTSPLSSEVSATPQLLLPTSEQTGYVWKYTTATPPSNWPSSAFNDAAWASGPAGFGTINFGGSVSRTPWSDTPGDIWIRRHFPVTGAVPANQQFRVFYDEDCEIYINGVLAGSATGYVTSYVSLPMTAAGQAALKVGDNVIAVHCHQTSGGQYIDAGIQTAL